MDQVAFVAFIYFYCEILPSNGQFLTYI